MSAIKINADDLILEHRLLNNVAYTLVLKADMYKPNTWGMIPNTNMVVFNEKTASEITQYNQAIQDLRKFQEIKYPKIREIKASLQSEINIFNQLIDTVYLSKQSKTK